MQKRKLISILEIIKNYKEIYQKLKLDLNSIFELSDTELSEILNCDKENDRFFKLTTYLDKSFLNQQQKEYLLRMLEKSKRELTIDEFLEIYESIKNNEKSFKSNNYNFSKFIATLDYILNTVEESYQLKYSVKALSNLFLNNNIQSIITSIIYSNKEYQAECLYRITNYPNIMNSKFLQKILEMIINTGIKEQAENVIMLGNSTTFTKNRNSLEIMKLISCAKGKYQALYGQLAGNNPIIMKEPNSLYLISLITTAKEDYQSEFTYKALCTDLIYRYNNTRFADLIYNSKSSSHAMCFYKIIKNFKFLNKDNSYEILKIISNSEFSNQALYGSEAINLAQQLGISDKTLEKIIKIICNTRIKETPKYIYKALADYRRVKRDDLMSVLRILSKSDTEEEAKEIYILFKKILEESTKETFIKSFKSQIKEQVYEYEDKKLEEIINDDIDEVISILKKCFIKDFSKESTIKVKKINNSK